jgi:hypothetical protein
MFSYSVYRGDEICVRVLGDCYYFHRIQGGTLIEAWCGISRKFEELQPKTIPHSKLKDILKNSPTVLPKNEWQTYIQISCLRKG